VTNRDDRDRPREPLRARSNQRIPLVALEHVLLPCRRVSALALIVPAELAAKFLSFQSADGLVRNVDSGGMTGFGPRLDAR